MELVIDVPVKFSKVALGTEVIFYAGEVGPDRSATFLGKGTVG